MRSVCRVSNDVIDLDALNADTTQGGGGMQQGPSTCVAQESAKMRIFTNLSPDKKNENYTKKCKFSRFCVAVDSELCGLTKRNICWKICTVQ